MTMMICVVNLEIHHERSEKFKFTQGVETPWSRWNWRTCAYPQYLFNRLTAAHIRLTTMQKKQPTQPAQPTKLVVAST